jgi:hypothetical protein
MKYALALTMMSTAALAYACGSDGTEITTAGTGGGGTGASGSVGGGACLSGLESLALTPHDGTFTLDGKPTKPIPFEAVGTFSDGHSEAVDANVLTWEVSREDDTPPGEITAGIFTPYPHAGGLVTITASDGCVTGTTTASLFLDVTIGQPSNPEDWQGNPVTGPGAATIVYPSDQTRFPRNLYRTVFQWHTAGLSEFRLELVGPHSKVTIYTDGVHADCAGKSPAAGCWEAGQIPWDYIAGSNAGATADWVVDGLDLSTTPPTIRRSETKLMGFSKQDVEGAIFYWSTTSAGVRRGKISQPDPEDYIVGKPVGTTYGNDQVGCVACHTVSRNGKYMLAPVKSSQTGSLWIMEVTKDAPPNPLVTDVPDTGGHGFATISPDDAHVVVSFKGDTMWMVDRATGAFQSDLPTEALGGGTHPDWSPDGSQLVFATENGDAPGNASIALIPWTGSDWGSPSVLLAPPSGKTNIFPMFSFDGAWIAFSQGKGGHGDNTSQLWIIEPTGGTPIELINANRITNDAMTNGQYQNSQPTWAPPGDLDWIAFNTKRPYGVILKQGTQQIWVAAIDLEKAAKGEDPSYPAFRVPFQGLAENNHRAFWTLDIGEDGGGGGGGGSPCDTLLPAGSSCSPVQDCCEPPAYCDSIDLGENYTCVLPPPQ